MIKGILKKLHKEVDGLHDAAYLLAVFALGSHILALLRDRLFAHFFGAGATLDLYYAAFRIPDFIFVSVASMVSLFVLIPFILEQQEKGKDTQKFLSNITSVFFLTIVFVAFVAFLIAPWLTRVLFPGFTSEMLTELVLLTRIMLLSPILLGLSNIFLSITQVYKRVYIYGLPPVLYNIGIIVGVLILYPVFGITGLAWGVVLGALFHLGVQIPVVRRVGLLPRLTTTYNWQEIRRVVATSVPRTIALSMDQVVLLVLVGMASLMTEGSIAIFNFASNLQGVPLSIIGVSYSVAAFPTLAAFFARGAHKEFFEHMVAAVRHVTFWSLPVLALFIVLRAQIVRVILGSGAFDWSDTRLTAAVLALFAISLVAQGLHILFVRGYYASGRTSKPLLINILSALLIITVSYIGVMVFRTVPMVRYFLESLLRIEDVPGTEVIMLALAYSVGMIANALFFWLIFRRDFGNHLPITLYRTFLQSFAAAIVAGVVAYLGLVLFGRVFDLDTFPGIFSQGFLSGLLGICAGVVTLWVLKNEEMQEIWEILHHKFWRARLLNGNK